MAGPAWHLAPPVAGHRAASRSLGLSPGRSGVVVHVVVVYLVLIVAFPGGPLSSGPRVAAGQTQVSSTLTQNHVVGMDVLSSVSPSSPSSPLSPSSPSSSNTPDAPIQHIAALFEVNNVTSLALLFNESLRRVNEGSAAPGGEPRVKLDGVSLTALQNVHNTIIYVCDAIKHFNITAFVAVGSQRIINTLSIVTYQTGIPVLAYVTEPAPMAVTVGNHGDSS